MHGDDLAQSELRHVAQRAGRHSGQGHRASGRPLSHRSAERSANQGRWKEAGISARELLRRRGTPYDELKLDNPKLTDAQLVAAMHKHPILIERPVVRTDKGTRLCRPAERVQDIL